MPYFEELRQGEGTLLSVEEAVASADDAGGRMWIGVAEPVRLRDYFLRLGARAEIVASDSGVVVLVESDDLDVTAYLDNWTTINGIQASVTRTPARKPSAIGQVPSPRPRLGDLLLGKGMITEPQLREGLSESYTSGELLGRIMLRHRWIFEDELARTLAEQLHLPYVNIRHTGVDRATARMMPSETGIHFAAIPLGFRADRVRVAFADPCDDQAREAVTAYFPHFDSVVSELSDIEQAWRMMEHGNATF
jgi:Type II secretion system (T2SS), protein E, N-terminal domain